MRRHLLAIVAGAAAAAGSLWGQENRQAALSAADVVERVQSVYTALEDASADFTQTVTFRYARIVQRFTGVLKMKKGNRYRIESQQQALVTDGTTVWIYSPVNKQVLIDRFQEDARTFSPQQFLFGLPKNYQAALLNNAPPSTYLLKLVPREQKGSFVKSLKAWVSSKDWSVQKVEYTDANDTQTAYELTNLRFNAGLADDLFVFTVPAGADVLDARTLQQTPRK